MPKAYVHALKASLQAGGKIPSRIGWYEGGKYIERQVWPEDIKRAQESIKLVVNWGEPMALPERFNRAPNV